MQRLAEVDFPISEISPSTVTATSVTLERETT